MINPQFVVAIIHPEARPQAIDGHIRFVTHERVEYLGSAGIFGRRVGIDRPLSAEDIEVTPGLHRAAKFATPADAESALVDVWKLLIRPGDLTPRTDILGIVRPGSAVPMEVRSTRDVLLD